MSGQAVLVVAPHGLDEVLGCGGTIARHAKSGDRVKIVILCGDGTGHDERRRQAAREVAGVLGAEPPVFAGFPENRSDTVALGEIVGAIEREAAEIAPDTVYVSHGGNLNIDHQTAFRATVTALRPVPGLSVGEILAYEIASSTDWAPRGMGERFDPNHFVDIAETLDLKLEALALYEFEMRPEPHARSIAALRGLAMGRGASVGLAAAEAFMGLRRIVR